MRLGNSRMTLIECLQFAYVVLFSLSFQVSDGDISVVFRRCMLPEISLMNGENK